MLSAVVATLAISIFTLLTRHQHFYPVDKTQASPMTRAELIF
jgi:hypothetical protein